MDGPNNMTVDEYTQFRSILKKKGTGKTMSKHMNEDDVAVVLRHLKSPHIPLAMKATLLVAWRMLDKTPPEAQGWNTILSMGEDQFPKDLHFIRASQGTGSLESALHRVMNGHNLDRKTVWQWLDYITSDTAPRYMAASFFESLRLKEETFEENAAVFDFFRKHCMHESVDVPVLIDMATAYDGMNRHYFLQPFVAAVLASVGIPTVLHGVQGVSPKNGYNTHKLFLDAGKHPLNSLASVVKDIQNPSIGWGYVDQSVYNPILHQLVPTRVEMVKRPVLATIEKWMQPISAQKTVVLTGFTHPPYKQKTVDLIHHAQYYDQLMLIRGVEGSTLFPGDRRTPFITSTGCQTATHDSMSPESLGMPLMAMSDQDPNQSHSAGIRALRGQDPHLRDLLVYQALAIGCGVGRDPILFQSELREAISSGRALSHWDQAGQSSYLEIRVN